jgi:hypothetical protein
VQHTTKSRIVAAALALFQVKGLDAGAIQVKPGPIPGTGVQAL